MDSLDFAKLHADCETSHRFMVIYRIYSRSWDEAKAANDKLLPMMDGLFETTNPILVKEALKLVGFPVGGVRLPLVDATPEQSERLAAIMREVGVL